MSVDAVPTPSTPTLSPTSFRALPHAAPASESVSISPVYFLPATAATSA